MESKRSRSEKNLNEKEHLQDSDEPHNPPQVCHQRAYQLRGTEQVVCNYERKRQYHGELQNTQCFRLR